MDVTFIISAIIFTLLAIVVATSIFKGSSPAAEFVNAGSYLLAKAERPGLEQNGHGTQKKKTKKEVEDWTEISGSSHDHWDVVKSVLSAQEQTHPHTEEAETAEHSSRSSLSVPCCGSRHMSLEVDSSSGRIRRSFGLSDTELLKCAFSYPQTEGATESPEANAEKMETSSNNSLKYTPGKARSHHLEMMMSKEELAEEQRVQREQLAAIFQLLKENKETFGDMSEGDLEDQLRLYSI